MTRIIGAINKDTGEFISPNYAKKGIKYECIDCKTQLFFRKGINNIPHFAHFYFSNSNQSCKTAECDISKLMLKKIFESKSEIRIIKMCNECGQECDFEILNIYSDGEIILNYNFEHNNKIQTADVAYLLNGKIIYIFKMYHRNFSFDFKYPEPWFEIDAINLINNYNNYINGDLNFSINCIRKNVCEKCSNPGGKIYFNQRGAGCGKTYESIQLLTQKNIIFKNKNIFIYLTKVHSAKDVIYGELLEQQDRGALCNLVVVDEDDNIGKQYKMTYLNVETNKEILVIIGTIDSFNCAMANKETVPMSDDYFSAIIETIKNGNVTISSKNRNLKYARKNPVLNENCLIIVDESQDLIEDQIRAFDVIVDMSKVDVYVIGDKLQSIWREDNVYTCIDNAVLTTPIIKNVGLNKCLRFHNEQFINFVNHIIPFENYGLPPITEICDGNCRYIHENNIKPYVIFDTPKMRTHENTAMALDYIKMHNIILYITKCMDNEIKKYNYLPNNFMFIFPILSKNAFAKIVEIEIQKYWHNKFNDPEYQENVLANSNHWKNKINIINEDYLANIDDKECNSGCYKYIYLHKSEEGKSINLKESENASRIVTIHTSKGTGREVVFLLGMNELSIKIFSKTSLLVYESLVHVALTRQKKSIYIGIENNNDDICRRFRQFEKINISE